MEKTAQVVYVLGAGASAASDCLPLGYELVWQMPGDCGLMIPVVNGKPDMSAENERLKLYREFLRRCEAMYSVSGLLSRFDERGIYSFNPPYPFPKKLAVDEVLADFSSAKDTEGSRLVRLLIAEHLLGMSLRGPNSLYPGFAKHLQEQRDCIAVISLNFDCLFDRQLERHGGLDYLITGDEDTWTPRHSQVSLIKLHGSLNWSRCSKCDRISIMFPHVDDRFYRNRGCSVCGGLVEPMIVMPHGRAEDRLMALWQSAARHLNSADLLRIIGYSFPDYDGDVGDLVRSTVSSGCRVEVFDFADEDHRASRLQELKGKYDRILPGRDIAFFLDGFRGLVSRL